MVAGSLFSGVGLLDYGLHLAGFEHAWFCERDEFRRGILARRWPGVPVWDDVTALADAVGRREADGSGTGLDRAGRRSDAPAGVDLIAGGFPCKGVSSAGRRQGFGHPETVLWREMFRVVRELRPRYVLVENVAALLTLHDGELFAEVLGSLVEVGYSVEWDCFPASAFGAPHRRDRVFITAFADVSSIPGGMAEPDGGGQAWEPAGAREPAVVRRGYGEDRPEGPSPRSGAASADAERGVHGRAGRADVPCTKGAGEGGAPERERLRADAADASGVAVEWGGYRPAIRLWEELVGRNAPEPLVRRVDDGRSTRVDRSRLSALGDGVLVQAGWLCGRRILIHAQGTPDP